MSNKTTLLLGASSEIGLEVMRSIDGEGHRFIAHCNSGTDKLKALDAELKGTVHPIAADLSTEAGCAEFNQAAESICEVPDSIVILQAPPLHVTRFKSLSRESFQHHFDIQILGTLDVLKKFAPKMAKRGSGRIVFLLSSVTLGMPPSAMADYATAKFALLGLMRSIAAEYGPKGLNVNAVSPSMVETQFLNDIPDKMVELNAASHPLGRNASPADVAPAVALLLSEGAAYMNGVNIPVTGGEQL